MRETKVKASRNVLPIVHHCNGGPIRVPAILGIMAGRIFITSGPMTLPRSAKIDLASHLLRANL